MLERVLELLLRQPDGQGEGVDPGGMLPCPGGEGNGGDLIETGKAVCCRLDLRSPGGLNGWVGVGGEPPQGGKVFGEGRDVRQGGVTARRTGTPRPRGAERRSACRRCRCGRSASPRPYPLPRAAGLRSCPRPGRRWRSRTRRWWSP